MQAYVEIRPWGLPSLSLTGPTKPEASPMVYVLIPVDLLYRHVNERHNIPNQQVGHDDKSAESAYLV